MTMSVTEDLTLNINRKTELRRDKSYIHIMKYMGSKRELLPNIKTAVKNIISENDTILDIFAGTGSVGTYLKNEYNIYSNDIQSYSNIITNALICSNNIELLNNQDKIILELKKKYEKNKQAIIDKLPNIFKQSKEFVNINKNEWTDSLHNDYLKFYLSFPSPLNKFKTNKKEFRLLTDMYLKRNKQNSKLFPYIQTTFLFSETYFSIEQSIDIDSIYYAIDTIVTDKLLKSIYLTALIYAYSYSSSGTGHFAMFRDISSVDVVEDIFIYRKKNTWKLFTKKLNELLSFHKYTPNKIYKSFSCDYVNLLDNKEIMKDVNLVYADPPYSFVHYSRFYHAVESLIKYDYNIPKFKGRYRTDRHQSPFCQKTNVKNAFDLLFKKTKKQNSNILLSYADSALISLDEIKKIITNNNFDYHVEAITYNHSTMGRKGHKNNKINEYLIYALL